MDTYKLKWTILDQEVFSFLCKRSGEKLSQREIALALKASPTAVSNSIRKLNPLLKTEKTKTINFISFNRDEKKAIELKMIENLKEIYTSGLKEYLDDELAGGTIILFGSYSKGEDTIKSDMDIAVIGRKSKKLDLESFEKSLYRKININFYSSWKEISHHLKNNILNGIVLSGGVDL